MLKSADRGGDGAEINIQTFYPTNISPELYLHTNTWEIVENALSDRWTCSDTTYVVTGCYYGDDKYELIDASSWGLPTDGKSKTCIMPVARYRVILKTRSGNTGKPVAECSADELISIGFWFPQAFNGQKVYEENDKSQWIFSVADIEKKIGGEFSFFPTVPEEVKQQRNLSDWGL
jgi:endonuclease G